MKLNVNTSVHHLTRVEGHGDIHIRIKDNKLQEAQWSVVETPRFFEAMLQGKDGQMAHLLTARICGICSIGHALASLRAVENAFQVTIPGPAQQIRLLAKHGETLQSHILHLAFLVLPDFMGTDSVIPLVQSHPQAANAALRIKKAANDLCDLMAGRTTHPVNFNVGGVNVFPDKRKIKQFLNQWNDVAEDFQVLADLFGGLTMPDFTRETEFVALQGKGHYPWIGGNLVSTDGIVKQESDYLAMTNEYIVDFSTSKHTKLSRESFAVGALARVNLNFDFLVGPAQEVARSFGLTPVNHNPFMNNIAQLVESVHVFHESAQILAELLDGPEAPTLADIQIKPGFGVGAVEVPRGILYHHYEVNEQGHITKANCIIPTTQNNANIHYDLADLVSQDAAQGKSEDQIVHRCEMLVRAYDPCISCSVH